jgi:hypothetical protein
MYPLLLPSNLTETTIRELIEKNNGVGFAVKNIPNEEYHRGPGISSSDIKALINGTVKSWIHNKLNPEPPTPTQRLGTAIHTMVLEPDQFWARYCFFTDAPAAPGRATKEGKAEWKEYLEYFKDKNGEELRFDISSEDWKSRWMKWRHPDFKREIISSEDWEICKGIYSSVKAHPMINQMFADGDSEVSMYWIDRETNILCKARADRLNHTFPCIPDLKSTEDAGLDAFEHQITSYDYHVSAFWYLWGAKEVFQKDFENFVYVPCEKKPPYQVTFYTADEGSLSVAEGLCRAGLTIYKNYLNESKNKKDVWTGHSLEPKSAGIRPYAFNKLSQVIFSHDLQGLGLEKFVGVV